MNQVKKDLMFSVGGLIAGIIMIAIFLLGVIAEKMSASMVMGMGIGLTSVGVWQVFLNLKAIKNPEKVEEIEINSNDERNILVREKTSAKSYSIFIYVEIGLVFITALLSYKEVSLLLLALVFAKLVVWFLLCIKNLNKY